MKSIYTLIFKLLVLSGALAQLSPKDVSVKINGSRLSLPLAGGLRAPQFSNTDFNGDGVLDLFIFDRDGGVVIPLVREGDKYNYVESYADVYPPARSWMLLRDYNGDGIEDVFCSPTTASVSGVEVWKGLRQGQKLTYERLIFPEYDSSTILNIPLGTTKTQVFVNAIDLPAIQDVDGDGDLDILSFEPGGSTVYWYKNVSVDKDLPLSELKYELGDICYGKFVESGFSEEVDLSTNPNECAHHNSAEPIIQIRHSGSTISSIDLNDDGRYDLLLGDVSYNGIVNLINDSDESATAWMTDQITHWPTTNPVDMRVFNAAYEVDYLGKKSIIVSPNDHFAGRSDEHIWLYQKQESGSYDLVTRSALIDDMTDLGKNTVPAFIDENSDGLIDLVVGSNGLFVEEGKYAPRLFLFRNVGTPSRPAYELADDDWLRFSRFESTSDWYAPAFGDLDNDGDIDLIVGDREGYLYYVENSSSDSLSFDWRTPEYKAFDIKVSAWATPNILDFNQDGHSDLLIGEQNFNSHNGVLGSINYFQNTTTNASGARFDPEVNNPPNSPTFGQIYLRDQNTINNYSALATYFDGLHTLMIAANEAGTLNVYQEIDQYNTPGEVFERTYLWDRDLFYLGRRITPALGDIDRDNKLEIVIGNSRGGLSIYDTDLAARDVMDSVDEVAPDEKISLSLLPNPTRSHVVVTTSLRQPLRVEVYNSSGQRLMAKKYSTKPIDVTTLIPGHYTMKVSNDDKVITTSFIKID